LSRRKLYYAAYEYPSRRMQRRTDRSYRRGKQLGLWVSDEVAERLGALSERLGLPQSQLLREALDLLFVKHERLVKVKKAAREKGATENN
jgi:predicted DNA-binding protein